MTRTDQIVNRHTARLLSELEDAGCPRIFVDAVKSKLHWLRDDLRALDFGPADHRAADAEGEGDA